MKITHATVASDPQSPLLDDNDWNANHVAVRDINTQTDDYTLEITDATAYVRMNKATANVLTVPPNSSVAFSVGTEIPVAQIGAGETTIAAGSGVTINSPETLVVKKRYARVLLTKVATNTWDLSGELEPSDLPLIAD